MLQSSDLPDRDTYVKKLKIIQAIYLNRNSITYIIVTVVTVERGLSFFTNIVPSTLHNIHHNQSDLAFSYHRARGLYFLTVILAVTILLNTSRLNMHCTVYIHLCISI